MITNKLKVAVLLAALIPCIHQAAPETSHQEKKLIDKIANANMPAFPWHEEEWEEKDYAVFLKNSVKKRITPKPRAKRINAFEFMKKVEARKATPETSVFTGPMTWTDLNLFCGDSNRKLYVGSIIDKTNLELGTISVLYTLATPTDDIDVLSQRQQIIKFFIKQKQLTARLQTIFAAAQSAENVMLSFWRIDNFKHASRKFYFNLPGFRWLNKYPNLLCIKSLVGHQTRIGHVVSRVLGAATLLAYSAMRVGDLTIPKKLDKWATHYKSGVGRVLLSFFNYKWLKPIKNIIDQITKNRAVALVSSAGIGLGCALTVPTSARWAHQCFVIQDCMQKLMINITQFVNTMYETYRIIRTDENFANYHEFHDLVVFFEEKVMQSKKLQELLKLLQANTFKGNSSVLSNQGNVLRAFSLMHELKYEFENALVAMGNIDKWLSIAQLFEQHRITNNPFCFASYKQSEKPFVQLEQFWHPLISTQNVIQNSITLGTNDNRQNIVVTDPNAVGKSNVLKAIAINIVMAQTFGIAPATSMIFTPFSFIATQLNVFDNHQEQTGQLLTVIDNLIHDQHSFVISKETNYDIINYLHTNHNIIYLFAAKNQ